MLVLCFQVKVVSLGQRVESGGRRVEGGGWMMDERRSVESPEEKNKNMNKTNKNIKVCARKGL